MTPAAVAVTLEWTGNGMRNATKSKIVRPIRKRSK